LNISYISLLNFFELFSYESHLKKYGPNVLPDFDGTIFMQDTGHILFDAHGCGSKRRELLDAEIRDGKRSFREVSEDMWGSLNVPFEDGFEVLEKTLEIDPDFQAFHKFCIANKIPFNVISAGLKPILRRVLDTFLGEEDSAHIDIVANDAQIAEDGSEWKPVWRHDTELGHDKALSITEARAEAHLTCEDGTIPLIVFIGDGVSDLPAARQADVLFARRGLRLEEYCVENKIPYIPFDTFADIQKEVTKIMIEDEKKTAGLGKPARFNPRANLWRRVSSKTAVCFPSQLSEHSTNIIAGPTIHCRNSVERREDVLMAKCFLGVQVRDYCGDCCCLDAFKKVLFLRLF
jgi:2,3-diketo-5-methylthio-1-phosphopentane phosphatase